MHVAHSRRRACASRGRCLVDRYLEGALELDVDALCDGEDAWVAAVLEHVEPAGVHSGDSACVLPGPSVSRGARGRDPRGRDAGSPRGLGARGLMNLQLALHGGQALRARGEPARVADRAVRRQGDRRAARRARGAPAARRAAGALWACPSGRCPTRAWAKEAVFPSERFPGAATRGPEMRSTGEVMAGAATAVRGLRARRARRRALDSGAARSARRSRRRRYPRAVVQRHPRRDRRGDRGGREGRRRDGHRHDPLGAAPAGREDGRPRGRPLRRLGLGRLRRGRRRRARQADLRRRASRAASTTASPTARPGRSGSPAAARSTSGSSRPTPSSGASVRALLDEDGYGMLYTNTDTGEKRLERGVLESTGLRDDGIFAEVVEGPLRVIDLRRRRGRRAPLRLRQAARLAHDRRRRAPRARDAASACRAPTRSSRPGPTRSPTGSTSARSSSRSRHEERLDIPAIAAALERNARYIGAIGAKRTQERRRAALSEQGFSESDLDRIHGPAGPRSRRPLAGAGRARDRGRDRRRVTSGGRKKDKAAVARCLGVRAERAGSRRCSGQPPGGAAGIAAAAERRWPCPSCAPRGGEAELVSPAPASGRPGDTRRVERLSRPAAVIAPTSPSTVLPCDFGDLRRASGRRRGRTGAASAESAEVGRRRPVIAAAEEATEAEARGSIVEGPGRDRRRSRGRRAVRRRGP